jgi:hypothetical protein
MPRSLARLSASESSHRDLSSAVFITNIAESDFRYTQGHDHDHQAAIWTSKPLDIDNRAVPRAALVGFVA